MGTKRAQRLFVCVVLGVASLTAALEVAAARATIRAPKPRTAWLAPLETMNQAIERGDITAAELARHEAYEAAIGSRRWHVFLMAAERRAEAFPADGALARVVR